MVKQKRWVAIASAIKVAIRRGELDAGSRIASEIEMASQWNVSPMTPGANRVAARRLGDPPP
jgi:GntR family transcriptional regulator of arabinose operon